MHRTGKQLDSSLHSYNNERGKKAILVIKDMAPRSKAIPIEVKQQKALEHIRLTSTCHTLKDLEKSLPSIAGVNSIQVKDLVTGLLNDNKIRIEKIGSNNWYWSFPSDERRELENTRERLSRELTCLNAAIEQQENELHQKQTAAIQEKGSRDSVDIERERQALMEQKADLSMEVERLQEQLSAYAKMDVLKLKQKAEETKTWNSESELWEDNISIMEQYIHKLTGGDRGLVDYIKRQCYGDESEDHQE